MLLAATGLGIGSVWTGIYPVEDRVAAFRKLLNLPEEIVPLGLVVLGRATSVPEAKSRFNAERVHRDLFGQH